MAIAPHRLPIESAHAAKTQIRIFEELYREYSRRILRYCMRLTKERDIAEELMQETFLRAWRRIDTLNPDRSAWPWLKQIASNVCCDRHRHVSRQVSEKLALGIEVDPAEERAEALVTPPADDDLVTRSLDAELEVALSDLKPRYKHLLYLHAIEGWSYRDLAHAEGSTVTSVAKILMRAKSRVRSRLGEHRLPNFGLLPVLVLAWARRRARDVQARANNMVSWTGTALRDVVCYQFMIPGLLASSAVLGSLPAAASTPTAAELPALEKKVIALGSVAEDRSPAQVNTLQVNTEAAAVTLETGSQRSQGVDPTGGELRIEVRGEDGEPIAWHESNQSCGNGGNLLPDEAPLAIYC